MARNDPKHQRKRKKAGNAWEHRIQAENDLLTELGRAECFRSFDALRVVGTLPNGHFDTIRVSKSEPDFHGTLQGGLSFTFDAKRTESPRLATPDPKKPKSWFHQVVTLSRVTRLGGIGFLYVLHDDPNRLPGVCPRYVLPCYANTIAGRDPSIDRRGIVLADHPGALAVPRGATWFDVVADNIDQWRDHAA